jgi:hypothetical protein
VSRGSLGSVRTPGAGSPLDERRLFIHDILRYARGGNTVDAELDGYRNFHHLTNPPDAGAKQLLLEAGINRAARLRANDGERRPALLLRSSPWNSGKEVNPWEDVFDLDHGHVRYYGDHKATKVGPVGVTDGNRALLDALVLYGSARREDRAKAPPLLLFRSVSVVGPDGRLRQKGHVEFCGVGILERLEMVVQREAGGTRTFPNLVIDIVVADLADGADGFDWRWIDDRRNAELSADETLRFAPENWRRWVERGQVALPGVRRRVLSSRVKSASDQRPRANSVEALALDSIYAHFEGRKHRFEALAAAVAAQVFERSGARYLRGWLTRMGGDGGMDFVGRLDAGSTQANTPIVILGQAKCVKPTTSISPDEVARVVARLRRGWIGIFVTTGVFSKQAQVEVIDDEYPIVLVAGLELAREVLRMAELSFEGDVRKLLDATVDAYELEVTSRRPEEILAQA